MDYKLEPKHIADSAAIKAHPLSQTVITLAQAISLVGADEDERAPNEVGMTDEEFNKYVEETEGMTFEQFAHFRWPDEPMEQYKAILEILGLQE